MRTFSSKTAGTVEERRRLPSEEAQEGYMQNQGFKLPTRDTSAFQETSESFTDTTKALCRGKRSELFDVEVEAESPTRTRKHGNLV